MMNISYRGVELHRYRLRKKVAIIPRGKPIQVFIINIKLSIFYIYIFFRHFITELQYISTTS
jgi:hypothetical protein